MIVLYLRLPPWDCMHNPNNSFIYESLNKYGFNCESAYGTNSVFGYGYGLGNANSYGHAGLLGFGDGSLESGIL